MKIKKSTKRRNITLLSSAVVLVACLAVGYLSYRYSANNMAVRADQSGSVNYNEPTKEQKELGSSIKQNSTGKNDNASDSGSDAPPSPTDLGNGKSEVSMTINNLGQTSSALRLRTLIGAVTNTGSCTATLVKNNVTIEKTADVQAMAGESTCKGFDIPLTELSSGKWTVSIKFENDKLVASAQQDVTVTR